jgi:alanyl-tRNA synthetase
MRRAYWNSPDIFEFDVDVVSVGEKKVTINPDVFHPDEGGQPADRGTIGSAVVQSINLEDGETVITLDSDLKDGSYRAIIDKTQRLFTSRFHTAQHIVSGLAESDFGLKTVGVHIGEISTIDFDNELNWDNAVELETQSNEIVMENIPVETSFGAGATRFNETIEKLDSDDIRIVTIEKLDSDDIRIVTIGEIDSSACCGAHAPKTGNVGLIKIISLEKKRDGSRISFVVGSQAMIYSQNESHVLRELRKNTSCSNDELSEKFQQLTNKNKKMNRELITLRTRLLPSIVDSCEVLSYKNNTIGYSLENLPGKIQNKLTSMISDKHGIGIVVSEGLISIVSKTISAVELLSIITKKLGGKGGGNEKNARGIIADTNTKIKFAEIFTE